ncbi:DUF1800 domain-containing protein [Rhodocaloribacter sp.]
MNARFLAPLFLILIGCLPAATLDRDGRDRMPYAAAGLTEREAAAHLLSRFTFGPRPGDVDRVAAMGLEAWFEAQLRADAPEDALEAHLARLPALALPDSALLRVYPRPVTVRNRAIRDGYLTRADLEALPRPALEDTLRAYREAHGYRPFRELHGQLFAQKLLRARYAENQLSEVLTDFWFNHFNVAFQDGQTRPYLLSYERSAIRPNVLGHFRTLLGATAKHPAMLLYLDNARSSAAKDAMTTLDVNMSRAEATGGPAVRRRIEAARRRMETRRMQSADAPARPGAQRGVNENYARELMELHTLGVDGGYTQADVEEVARAFTGWTVLPATPERDAVRARLEARRQAGFVIEGDFLFRPNLHDAGEKHLLGETFPEGGGLDEGERVLDLLAAHPSTARHLARKLAVRFVSDDPPEALVDDLAAVYRDTGGDLRAVVRAIAYSPYFWEASARQAKVKSPLELSVSALRALDADLDDPRGMLNWLRKMGQPLYAYQAPTGYPDRAEAWINTGTLLNRMNFAMRLASGRIRGVTVNLPALNRNREPASMEAALTTYARLLLPGRDVTATVAQLLPMASDPGFARRLDASARRAAPPDEDGSEAPAEAAPTPAALARVVGVILGSPDFQRR